MSTSIGTYTATRPRGFAPGFAPWSPRAGTQRLLAEITRVLVEYAQHLPLTLRQVFYVLVGRDLLDKTENAYGRLCETANRARRAGLLPWEAFRDDGTIRRGFDTYEGPDNFLDREREYVEHYYRRDRLAGQACSVEVWFAHPPAARPGQRLTVVELAKRMQRSPDYIYRHWKKWPFAIRDGRSLSFDEAGYLRWNTARQRQSRIDS